MLDRMGRPERFQLRVVLQPVVEQVTIDRLLLRMKKSPCHAAALTRELHIGAELSERVSRRRIRIRRVDAENPVARSRPKELLDGGRVALLVSYRPGGIGPRLRLAGGAADDHGHWRILPLGDQLNRLGGKNMAVHVGTIYSRQHAE